jgi:transglutaminase-like putative cysteine protease
VRDSIYFLNDPAGTEWLQSPRATLDAGAGDCDDRATLLASMLQSFGVRSRFKVIAVDRRRPGSFSHVYLVADVSGRQVPLDPTYPDNEMGFEHRDPFRSSLEYA